MAVAPSLFAPPSSAVLSAAADSITGTLLGGLATSLCVLAIAFVGLLLMTGRLAIRDGMWVAIGCFVLLGASVIAGGLQDAAYQVTGPDSPRELAVETAPSSADLPAADHDRYAGASLRRD